MTLDVVSHFLSDHNKKSALPGAGANHMKLFKEMFAAFPGKSGFQQRRRYAFPTRPQPGQAVDKFEPGLIEPFENFFEGGFYIDPGTIFPVCER